MNSKTLHLVTWILIIVGALNWGVVGLGNLMGESWNVVSMLLGAWPTLEQLVYALVGVSAVYEVLTHKKNCRACS
jgi:uncharacterized membrane protein YuzA (DUF378 family)